MAVAISIILIGSIYLELKFGAYGAWLMSGILLTLAWILLSVRQVQVDEIAGIEFFGAPVKEAKDGPHFVPYLLFRFGKFPAYVLQHEFPGEPENVFKGLDVDFDHASNLVRPIRITTGSVSNSEDLNDGKPFDGPLEVQMTAEIAIILRWRIKVGAYFEFRRNVQTIENAIKQLRDTSEGALVEIAGKGTMGYMVRNTKKINTSLEEKLHELVESWGVEVKSAAIKEPDLSREVNLKLAAIAEAKASGDAAIQTAEKEAIATIATAEADKKRQILEGAGAAEAERLRLVAKGKGIKRFAKDAGVCGGEVLGSEVADNMFGESDQVVLGGADGLKDVFAAAKVVTAAYAKPKATETDEKEETT